MQLFAFRALHDEVTASKKPGRIVMSIINPGFVATEIMRHYSGFALFARNVLKKILSRTTEEGGWTLVHAAEGGRETDGQYLNDCQAE